MDEGGRENERGREREREGGREREKKGRRREGEGGREGGNGFTKQFQHQTNFFLQILLRRNLPGVTTYKSSITFMYKFIMSKI